MIQTKELSGRWYRKLPFPVSKVIGGFYCLFDNGLSYTWYHLWGKVGRRLKSCGKLPNLADALLILAHETGVSTSKPAPAKPAPVKPVLSKLPAEGNAQLMQELRLARAEIVALRKEFSVREEYLETLVLRTRVGDCRPSVSVVVAGASTREDVVASMKDLQTTSIYELEILFAVDGANDEALNAVKELQRGDGRVCVIDSHGRNLAEVRNEGLSCARGDYIAFIGANDRYYLRSSLEYLTLTAFSEKANVCGGKSSVNVGGRISYADGIGWNRIGKQPSNLSTCQGGGLAGFIFNRKWLLDSGLRFARSTQLEDDQFVRAAKILAGEVCTIGKIVIVRGRDPFAIASTSDEKSYDRLRYLGILQKLALERECKLLNAEIATELLETRKQEYVNLMWTNGLHRDLARQLCRELTAGFPQRINVEEEFFHPLVSFIIPVYNTAKEVGRCIDSILSVPIKEIEVICIDDGSTDESLKTLQDLAAKEPRIMVLSQKNSGQGAARNLGIKHATGRYVQYVDSDDFIDSAMYPKVLQPFHDYEDIDFVQFLGTVHFSFEATAEQKKWGENIFKTTLPPGLHEMGPSAYITTTVWNKVFKREFIVENDIRFPGGVKQEDEAFSFFVFARAKRFYMFHDKWYRYVRTQTGTMSSQETAANVFKMPDCYKVFAFILDFLKREPALPLLGYFYKRVIGATTRFRDTPIYDRCKDCAAFLLRQSDFTLYYDLMIGVDKAMWLQKLGREFLGREIVETPDIPRIHAEYPIPLKSLAKARKPRLSYLVLLDTFEVFVPRCLQSLVEQTLSEIEIVCVTTEHNDRISSVMNRFSRFDGRISLRTTRPSTDRCKVIREALKFVNGSHVVIHEAKNILPRNHAERCIASLDDGLDVLLVPDRYFDAVTQEPKPQYWMYEKQSAKFPRDKTWSIADFKDLCFNLDTNHHCYRVSFLMDALLKAPRWEEYCNATFLHLLCSASRMSAVPDTFCNIRFGDLRNALPIGPTARAEINVRFAPEMFAVMKTSTFGALDPNSQCLAFLYVLDKIQWLFDRTPMMRDAVQDAVSGLPSGLIDRFSQKYPERWKRLQMSLSKPATASALIPEKYQKSLQGIVRAREAINPDLYIVVAFLLDPYAECIDSWTFFTYLKKKNVPAKYVIPAHNGFYKKVVEPSEWAKDVIAVEDDSNGSGEFLEKLMPHLYRAKAIVTEDGYLPMGLAAYFKEMDRLSFVFMQHGVTYIWINELTMRMFDGFNAVNVSGDREKNRIAQHYKTLNRGLPFEFVDGGFPRFDLLPKARNGDSRTVLIALSWRNDFKSPELFKSSIFYQRYVQLLESSIWAELKKRGVNVVLAIHHAMRRELAGKLDINTDMQIVDPTEISSYIRKASCLVTDLSSVAFDFIYQKKPVVFWIPDKEDFALSFVSRAKIASAQMSLRQLWGEVNSIAEIGIRLNHYADNNFELDPDEARIADSFFFEHGKNRLRLHQSIERLWASKYSLVKEEL